MPRANPKIRFLLDCLQSVESPTARFSTLLRPWCNTFLVTEYFHLVQVLIPFWIKSLVEYMYRISFPRNTIFLLHTWCWYALLLGMKVLRCCKACQINKLENKLGKCCCNTFDLDTPRPCYRRKMDRQTRDGCEFQPYWDSSFSNWLFLILKWCD